MASGAASLEDDELSPGSLDQKVSIVKRLAVGPIERRVESSRPVGPGILGQKVGHARRLEGSADWGSWEEY